jgi:hypothetical protein
MIPRLFRRRDVAAWKFSNTVTIIFNLYFPCNQADTKYHRRVLPSPVRISGQVRVFAGQQSYPVRRIDPMRKLLMSSGNKPGPG